MLMKGQLQSYIIIVILPLMVVFSQSSGFPELQPAIGTRSVPHENVRLMIPVNGTPKTMEILG